MLLTVLALAASFQATPPPADTTPVDTARVAPALLADAYLDADAREMVRLARERSDWTDSSIVEYRTLAKERISVGVRAMRRDRVLYRRELAARIHWRREGTGRVQLLGARQVVPVAVPEPRVPSSAAREAADLAFDPTRELLLPGLSDRDDEEDDIRHPLADGSEAHYRFASGDTTRIRLASGKELRLAELRVIPRRPEGLLLRGSLWLDLDTHSAVRGVFQLARPLDFARDLQEEDDDIPGILQPIEADLRYFTIEYALWEDRWWLPRLMSLDGEARLGGFVTVPLRFERSYEDYEVSGAGMPPIVVTAADTIADVVEEEDSVDARPRRSCERGGRCWIYRRASAADSVLLRSEHLPGSIYDEGGVLITDDELRQLADVFGAPVPGGSSWHAPVTRVSYLRPDLVRYNRVEGLALGGRLEADFGAADVAATLWLGTADRQLNGELGARRQRFGSIQRLAVYRRLEAVEPDVRALGFGSSLSALLLGRDDSDYYRTVGAEVVSAPAAPGTFDYSLRTFVEQQSRANKSTDVSLPYLFSESRTFHENILARSAVQYGAEVGASYARGADPLGVRWSVGASVLAATGDYRFARPTARAFMGFPLPLGWVGALELAGGTAFGNVPIQSLWYLGGPATVRGYGGASRIAGPSYWRGRGEVASSFPGARLALFSDAGWAGRRDAVELDPKLLSAGVGLSLLDGLLRMDLARALRGDIGWRFDLYFDGVL